jgi:hypothetical protein
MPSGFDTNIHGLVSCFVVRLMVIRWLRYRVKLSTFPDCIFLSLIYSLFKKCLNDAQNKYFKNVYTGFKNHIMDSLVESLDVEVHLFSSHKK